MKSKISISKDKFNSEIFNINFGYVEHYESGLKVEDINECLKRTDYNLIGVKIDSSDLHAMYNFQMAGFYVVDCLVTYEYDKKTCKPLNDEYTIKFRNVINESEKIHLANVASQVFKIDRFHSDPNLSKDLADKYYFQWVLNSFNGFSDGVIIPEIDGLPVAFTTYKINNVDDTTSTMVLSAVDSKFSGRGVYHNMIQKGTIELLKFSEKIRVGTQVDNIPVQRTWQKLGYKLICVQYVLHYHSVESER